MWFLSCDANFQPKNSWKIKPNFWNTETFESAKWDDSNSETFKTVINNYPIGDLYFKQNLEYEALNFIEHIAKSKQLITKKSNEKGQTQPLLNPRLS